MGDPSSVNPRIDAAKQALAGQMKRARLAARRDGGAAAGGLLIEKFREARRAGLAVPDAAVISGFWPLSDEIDIRKLMTSLHEEGMRLALPVTGARRMPLKFREWRPGDGLVSGPMGLSEPAGDAKTLDPDLLLVPLLAFDMAGNRLGYGGGYFDATLRELRRARPITAIGVAYDIQQAREVPVDGGDEPLDWIITEKRVIRAGRG